MSTYLSIPNPGDILGSQSQPQLKANFDYLASTLGKDHQISIGDLSTTSFEGRHIQVSFNNRATNNVPMPGDGTNALLWSNAGNLYIRQNSSFLGAQFTGPVPANATGFARFGTDTLIVANQDGGWCFLSGGLIFQYGFFTVTATSGTTDFPIPFTIGPFSVVITGCNNTVTIPARLPWLDFSPGSVNNNLKFSWGSVNSAGSNVFQVNWIAVGK